MFSAKVRFRLQRASLILAAFRLRLRFGADLSLTPQRHWHNLVAAAAFR